MKLSNKILIGFFSFLFLYLTAVFAEIRFRGTPNIIDNSNSIAETADISGVRHLVLPDLDKRIYVEGSDHPRLEVRSLSGDQLKKLKYHISGDTLTLSELELEKDAPVKISIYVNNLLGMTVNGASVTVNGLDEKELSVYQIGGQVRMDNNTLKKLHIEAINEAYFYMSGAKLDTLSTQLDDSQATIELPLTLLKGSIKNRSYLRVGGAEEIQFKKDGTSSLYLYVVNVIQ